MIVISPLVISMPVIGMPLISMPVIKIRNTLTFKLQMAKGSIVIHSLFPAMGMLAARAPANRPAGYHQGQERDQQPYSVGAGLPGL